MMEKGISIDYDWVVLVCDGCDMRPLRLSFHNSKGDSHINIKLQIG
jgi:hypothetical protein